MTTLMGRATALALTAAVAGAFAVSSAAVAQDFSQAPAYGSVSLNAGFPNDPVSVGLTAGGSIDAASSLGGGCAGFIANAPDYRVQYSAGGFPLNFYVLSDADTTLVVNAPDGQWYCNDDSSGLNPAVQFGQPMSGQYDVWVGTYGSSTSSATLYVTELSPF